MSVFNIRSRDLSVYVWELRLGHSEELGFYWLHCVMLKSHLHA